LRDILTPFATSPTTASSTIVVLLSNLPIGNPVRNTGFGLRRVPKGTKLKHPTPPRDRPAVDAKISRPHPTPAPPNLTRLSTRKILHHDLEAIGGVPLEAIGDRNTSDRD